MLIKKKNHMLNFFKALSAIKCKLSLIISLKASTDSSKRGDIFINCGFTKL